MVDSGEKVAKSEALDLHLNCIINILSDTQNGASFLPKFPQL